MDIEITLEDVKLIMGDNYQLHFKKVTESVFCPGCTPKYRATIVIGRIWLNHLGDIVLEGRCEKCGRKVQRYVETGVNPAGYEQAMAIRELKIEVLRDYKTRPE